MHLKKGKRAAACLWITLTVGLLAGCVWQTESTPELWVVTEQTQWDGMNSQTKQIIQTFEEDHPELRVKLDILPIEKNERELYIKTIRTQIMSGRGPDVYLLPTETTTTRYKKKLYSDAYTSEQVVSSERQPLFIDVEQVMRNGLFADISEFYDADKALEKDALNKIIMDAGTYRDGRYILPLRYDLPVLYVNVNGLQRFGLSLENINGNIQELIQLAVSSQNKIFACSVEPFFLRTGRGFAILPQTMDYQKDKVCVTREEISEFLRNVQALEKMVGEKDDHRVKLLYRHLVSPYVLPFDESVEINGEIFEYGSPMPVRFEDLFPGTLPMHIGTLDEAPMAFAFSMSEHSEYAMIPLRGIGDELTAFVTYYGAVGVGTTHAKEAYEFLSLFLSESAQFEEGRPYHTDWFLQGKRWNPILIEAGWPVRTRGSADAIWRLQRTQTYGSSGKAQVYRMRLTEEDLPPLQAEIDRVYFGCVLEQDFAQMIRSLNDQDTGEPTDVDIDVLAGEFIEMLTWHVMEG